jgi:hypothetical protein
VNEPDRAAAEQTAGEWFWDQMEICPTCGELVPWDDLIALIGTRAICWSCRRDVQEWRLDLLQEHAPQLSQSWPLAWLIGDEPALDQECAS